MTKRLFRRVAMALAARELGYAGHVAGRAVGTELRRYRHRIGLTNVVLKITALTPVAFHLQSFHLCSGKYRLVAALNDIEADLFL